MATVYRGSLAEVVRREGRLSPAYLLLCAAVGNAHLSSTGISPARAGRLSTYCRKALALLTR
jgi:hypothetical protein